MVLLVVMLVGVTAALIGSVSYSRARAALETAAKSKLKLLARDIAEHLHSELEDRAADTTNWAHLEVMVAVLYQDVDKELAQFLERSLQGRRIYRAIVCYDRAGVVVAAVGDAAAVRAPASPPATTRLSLVPPPPGEQGQLLQLESAIANPESVTEAIGTIVVLLDSARLSDTMNASVQGDVGPVALMLVALPSKTVVRTGEVTTEEDALSAGGAASTFGAVSTMATIAGAEGPTFQVRLSQSKRVALAEATALRVVLLRTGVVVLFISAALGALVAWRVVVPVRALTARVREIAERGEPIPDAHFPEANGEVGVLSAAFRSMMESLLRAQQESLAQSRLALLGEVAANVAHEVRTPLSVLKTSAQLLARPEVPAEEKTKLALMIAAEVNRLNVVVTTLVDLARPKPARYVLESLSRIIERAVAFFGATARDRGIMIKRQLPDREITVRGNADQLYQVLLNLVHNAIQAMPQGGVMTVACRRDGAAVTVEVADTGGGFAAAALPRVFAPFFTTKADGTGLGLAIAKRIVEEHGGTMGAINRPEGGALVWFKLKEEA